MKGGLPPSDGTKNGAGNVSKAGKNRPIRGGRGRRVVAAEKAFRTACRRRMSEAPTASSISS